MRFFAFIGVLAVFAAIGSAVYFFGGFYDVAAAQPDPKPVDWALARVREASIESRAPATTPSNLEDPQQFRPAPAPLPRAVALPAMERQEPIGRNSRKA